jgi:hypothetical protein
MDNTTFSTSLTTDATKPVLKVMNSIRERLYIIGIVDQIGNFSVSTSPVFYSSKTETDSECARLAKLKLGTIFVTMQLASGRFVPKIAGVAQL